MSAMLEENQLLEPFLESPSEIVSASRTYTSGQLYGHEIVMVFSRWGKIASAITASYLIHHFKIDCLIFTGVAGSCDKEVKVGDIVIADRLIQHDMDARPIYPQFEIPLIQKTYFETDKELHQKALLSAQDFLQNFPAVIDASLIDSYGLHKPAIHSGTIASGDKFFSSKDAVSSLKQNIPSALCVEMEGASIAQVCYEHNIPFCVMRTISDDGDESAFYDFASFVKHVASPYSCALIRHLVARL